MPDRDREFRAEDLAQTALAKLYVAWPRIQRDGQVDAYARKIVVRAAIDDSRRWFRRKETAMGAVPDIQPAPAPGVDDALDVRRALAALPAGQGNLFINLNPPAAGATVECRGEPNCHVITLPDGRKATLSQTDDGVTTISLSTIAVDGTRVSMWSRSRSARAEVSGSAARTRPQSPLGVDDLIHIASVAGLRW